MNCADCSKPMVMTSNAQKRCMGCRKTHNRMVHDLGRVRRGIRKSCGEGRGGKHNGGYIDGRSRKYYSRFQKKKCNRCPARSDLLVHHKDRNRRNNAPSNLETLCRPCHTREHKVEMDLGRGIYTPPLPNKRKAA